jgi:hypothetical protein
MDPATLVLPGAQSLVGVMLTDAWAQVRSGLGRMWAKRHTGAGGEENASTVEHAARELDAAREQALALAGQGDEATRAARMELFWAGYLAGQLAARPELAEAIRALPELLGAGAGPDGSLSVVHNSNSGTVHGNLVQARDIDGGISFR